MLDLCKYRNCKVKAFKRPWGDVFEELPIKVYVPTKRVYCIGLFGENYLLLSCMDLCLDKRITCPLNRTVMYDSCPTQFPDQVSTLANNSFFTFVH